MKKVNHAPDHDQQDDQDHHHQDDPVQNQDHDQRRDLVPDHDQNEKTHVIEVDHVTRKSPEASLQVKVVADPELPRKNPEDRDHDLDLKYI